MSWNLGVKQVAHSHLDAVCSSW